MKKLLLCLFTISAICFNFVSCNEDEEEQLAPGTIYGVVTDKATGEPIRSAGVELSPTGMKSITGSEGQFEFTELKAGQYTLLITKTGYMDYASNTIEVKPGATSKTDVQIEQLPPALRVINDNQEEISTIDFGSAESDIARSFNIFNDGEESLTFQVTNTATWIDSISKIEGTVFAGGIAPIVVFIDRDKLAEGENKTTLNITSNSGTKALTILATNNRVAISLNILETTDITSSSAKLNAEILNVGNPHYTERGFVYSTTQNPTIDDKKLVASGTGLGTYSANATEIAEGFTYYVRAYVMSNKGTVYGDEVQFDFKAIAPTLSTQAVTNINIAAGTATLRGKILTVGDPALTERGFVYGLTRNPSLLDGTKIIVSGAEQGDYLINVSALSEGKTYYVRAYATTLKGTTYGNEVSFTTMARMPTISTQAVTNIHIGGGTATFNGKVVNLGDLGYTERGFVYSTTQNPTIDDKKLVASGTGLGTYSANATEIAEGFTYYVRAYVTNNKGTVYGEEVSFDFNAIMPIVSTQAVTDKILAAGVATLHGTIESAGDPNYTERGFVYGIAHSPTKDDATTIVVSGTSSGKFTANLSNLTLGTTYFIRAYATCTKGTVYGGEVTLDFTATMPIVVTDSVKITSTTSAIVSATIEAVGDPNYTERGFVYGTMLIPTLDNGATQITSWGTIAGEFNAEMTNLINNTVYYVRAYAKSAAGVVYGEIKNISKDAWEYFNLPTMQYGGYTYKLYDEMGSMNWTQAKQACNELVLGGYTDWYLPNKEEMLYILINKIIVSSISKTWHTSDYKFDGSSSHPYCCYHDSQWYCRVTNRYSKYFTTSTIADVCAVRKYKE